MPRPLPIRLTPTDRRHLRFLLKQAPSRSAWTRAVAILLLGQGDRASKVSQVLGVSLVTLTRWKKRWSHRHERGLGDRPRPGRPPLAGRKYVRTLLRTVRTDPRKLGYAFARWTAPRLSQYLWEKTRVRLSPGWITKLLSRREILWRRTKRTIRNLQDPEELRRARLALKRLKRGPSSGMRITNCGSPTPSGLTCSRP